MTSTRQPLLVANWKMHKDITETLSFAGVLKRATLPNNRTVVICPPFTALTNLQQAFVGPGVQYGAQNMHWETSGAYTGEISGQMLVDVGCTYVIIGHSERRQYFHETDQEVNNKIRAALAVGLTPILCVGESLQQRQARQTASVVLQQIQIGLADVSNLDNIVIAYEPIWAIGTGETATPEQAQEVHALIRQQVTGTTRIIYGGSVKPDNITALMAQPDIDGALVGNASLDPTEFLQIVNY